MMSTRVTIGSVSAHQVAENSPFACRGPGEYFASVPDSCVFYYQCAETEPGVLNGEVYGGFIV